MQGGIECKSYAVQQSMELRNQRQIKELIQKNVVDKKNFNSFSLKHAHNFRQARNS